MVQKVTLHLSLQTDTPVTEQDTAVCWLTISAPYLSHLLIATTTGTAKNEKQNRPAQINNGAPFINNKPFVRFTSFIHSTVWAIIPSSAATTRTTTSVTSAPRARMALNAACPGVSRKVIWLPFANGTRILERFFNNIFVKYTIKAPTIPEHGRFVFCSLIHSCVLMPLLLSTLELVLIQLCTQKKSTHTKVQVPKARAPPGSVPKVQFLFCFFCWVVHKKLI